MKKKGFTLIELLAVIIILAVIALIATPIVLNVVDNARVEANRDSVYGLLDGAKLYYLEGQLDTNRLGMDGETNLIDKINVSGKRPSGGNVYIDDTGLIALSVVYDKVCYKKGFNENEITETKNIEECETKINDKTTPEITTVVTSKTDRIKVSLTCNDFESGIIKYEYKIDDNEWIESNNEYIFENLEKEREYEIRTRCTNGVNLVSEESKKISTKGIINPEIAQISQEPSSGTYAVKRIIRITYDNTNIENAKNYYSYDGKTWVEVNDTKIDLEFTDNSLLYAKTTDGINTSTYATYTIANIDTTVPDIKIDISNVKTDRVTLTLTCSAKSGITKYEYSKDDGLTWVEGSNSYTFTGLTQGTSYQYKGRCTNGSGLSNTISSEDSTYTIANPKIAQISQEPSSGTYAVKRIIRITYDNTNIENAKNYYSYDGKTWVEVNDTKIDLEFTSNSLLYAKTTDGINTSTYATYSVVNIDTIKPTLTLSKITYEEGFNNWFLKDSDIFDNILTLSNKSSSAHSKYYAINNEPWYIVFDGYTTSNASLHTHPVGSAGKGDGGIYLSSAYFNEDYDLIEASNGYSSNGMDGQLPLNTWSDGFSWNGWDGYGTKYLRIIYSTGNEYSQPTVKIRNFRLYGQLYNTFYLINVNSNDNIGIDVTKYAKGNVDISYFKSNGSIATSNEIRVTENGIYTVYVKDLAGNEVISTIEIDKIDKTAPTVSVNSIEKNTNETIITANCIDNESGITVYEFSKDNGETWINNGPYNKYTFINLTNLDTYQYKVRCVNGAGIKAELEIPKASFDYTGAEQTYTVPLTGNYKLEVWGAQGDTVSNTGYGGYSAGNIRLNKGDILYVVVGQEGQYEGLGGYNGGGLGSDNNDNFYGYSTGGGGATHIASINGTLDSIGINNNDMIYIVAGAGGGHSGWEDNGFGGAGGGYIGSSGTGQIALPGTQINGGTGYSAIDGNFGLGGSIIRGAGYSAGGGGAGYFGGGSTANGGGAGGSGYIGNSLLTNKVMYCYNCAESNDESTKTISTTNVSNNPISNYAKMGNGYAKIAYLGIY